MGFLLRKQARRETSKEMTELYLAGDCGGTKARVVIASQDSILARGEGGPCNL